MAFLGVQDRNNLKNVKKMTSFNFKWATLVTFQFLEIFFRTYTKKAALLSISGKYFFETLDQN